MASRKAKQVAATEIAQIAEPVVTAYKGFDKNLVCSPNGTPFQYEIGKTYTMKGHPVRCTSSGFHACESPFDVWRYYGPFENRFAVVKATGEISRGGDDSKFACASITIEAELKMPEFIQCGVNWLIALTKDIKSSISDSIKSHDENDAQIGSSGDDAQIGSSGNAARIGSSGNHAQIGSSGNHAQIGSSGDDAQIEAVGENVVVACAGNIVKFKLGKNGCAAIPYSDGKRVRFATVYIGENDIKPDVWYALKNGVPVEVSP